jgi:hypothetical protein
MQKPLSNLDYLFSVPTAPALRPASGLAAAAGPDRITPASALAPSVAPASAGQSSAQSSIDEAAVALGNPVLTALYRDPQGKQTAFQLVDTLDVSVQDLSPVLDVLSERFRWIEVDRSDRKGNYQITLTPRGREYIEKYGAI